MHPLEKARSHAAGIQELSSDGAQMIHPIPELQTMGPCTDAMRQQLQHESGAFSSSLWQGGGALRPRPLRQAFPDATPGAPSVYSDCLYQDGVLHPNGNMLSVPMDDPTFQVSRAVASERLPQP